MTIKSAPEYLVARGLFPGKEIKTLRKNGRLYHIRCDGLLEMAIDENTFKEVKITVRKKITVQ